MRIGWATPLHHGSAVGRFSISAAVAMARLGLRVDLLRTERTAMLREARRPSALKVRDLARLSDAQLTDYDLLVYNIANDAVLYGHAVGALLKRPGICIFHEFRLYGLFRGWMVARGEQHAIPAMMIRLYGEDAFATHHATADPGETARTPSMLKWLAPYALAAVTHDSLQLHELEGCCPGPVSYIPLARDLPQAIAPPRGRLPEQAFAFDAYAQAFLRLTTKALEAEPLMRLGAQLGQELTSLGADRDGPEALRIAQIATDLFCQGGRPCPTN